MPVDRNVIGRRGEAVVINLLTRLHGRDVPFFLPQFMGDKYPTVDLFIELVEAPGIQTPFFFAQVKSTRAGYTRREHRLNVRVSRARMSKLLRYPAPTYVIGVDEPNEQGFIMATVVGGPQQVRSLPSTYSLADRTTLQDLYNEVLAFWRAYPANFTDSRFV